ncbi:unnamed protein product [Microthlaspi erraticum]|uniref:Uncharacterized protein n=1 Tax=Microthlaspi erraticum TaxID=1685480 RepID=A0A6D2KXS8_9BRAS|nr:unnamed protein product [Microthlaspi erraticum]
MGFGSPDRSDSRSGRSAGYRVMIRHRVDRGQGISCSVIGFGRADDIGLNVLAGQETMPSWSDGAIVHGTRIVLRDGSVMPSCSRGAVVRGLWWRDLDGSTKYLLNTYATPFQCVACKRFV